MQIGFPRRNGLRRGGWRLWVVALAFGSISSGASESATSQAVRVEEGGQVRIIVGLRTGWRPEGGLDAPARLEQRQQIAGAQEQLRDAMAGTDAVFLHSFETLPFQVMLASPDALRLLRRSPLVATIEDDLAAPAALADSIPLIGADLAWDAGYDGSGVAVAILDTGVESGHAFFGGRVVAEACFSSAGTGYETLCPDSTTGQVGAGAAAPTSCAGVASCDHGTHVAGIAAGSGVSFSGVGKGASILAVQVFTKFTSEAFCGAGNAPCLLAFSSDQLRGLEHVLSLEPTYTIAAANVSIGGGFYDSEAACDADNPARKAGIDNLRSVGIATVIAAGNNGYTDGLNAPACISTAVAVGSTTKSDDLSSLTNSSPLVDLLAPGSSIESSVTGGGFGTKSGTSMATPHVAGAWAVLKSYKPEATVSEVLSALSDNGQYIIDFRNGVVRPRIEVDDALSVMAPLALFVGDATQSEDGSSLVFTVELSPASGTSVTVDYATAPFNAEPDDDYSHVAGTLTFDPGDTAKTITVPLVDDAVAEFDEWLLVELSNPTGGAAISRFVGGGLIRDDDDVSLSIDDATVTEGDTGTTPAEFDVALSGPASYPITVRYAPFAGTASSDASSNLTEITIPDRGTPPAPASPYPSEIEVAGLGGTLTKVRVTLNGFTHTYSQDVDVLLVGPSGTASVLLSDVGGGSFSYDLDLTIDADAAQPLPDSSLSSGCYRPTNLNDGEGTDNYASPAPAGPYTSLSAFNGQAPNGTWRLFVVDDYSFDGGALLGGWTLELTTTTSALVRDFEGQAGTVTFAPGETLQTVTVPVVGDRVLEADETFGVRLANPFGATLADDEATGTILNDDSTLLVCPAAVGPGSVYTVEVHGGASATDWLALYPNGAANDAYTWWAYVPLPRPQAVQLTAPTTPGSYDLRLWAENTASTQIGSCDLVVATSPTLSVGDVTVAETQAGTTDATFTVALTPAATGTVTVDYATANGTAGAGTDYLAANATLTFAAGETSKTVTVTVQGDSDSETDETFFLDLTNATGGATIGDAQAIGHITNDDSLLACPTAAAPGSPVTVQVLGGSSATDWVAAYPDGAANDAFSAWAYVPLPRPQSITLTAPTALGSHDIRLWANNTTTTLLGSCDLAVVSTPTLAISDATVAEGAAGATGASFTVTLSPAAAGVVTVAWTTADDTATAGSDYVAAGGVLTFAVGETTKTVLVDVSGDTIAEPTERFRVNLSSPTGGALLADGQGVGTITNDDALLSCPASVAPGGTIAVQVFGGTTATDWLGLYPDGAGNSAYSAWTHVPLPRPQTVSLAAPAAPGSYDLRLWADNSVTQLLGACDLVVASAPTLAVADVTAAEGDAGTGTATFVVTLSPAAGGTVTVDYATANETALAGSDYAPQTGTLTFAVGETSKSVEVTIHGDVVPEADETFRLVLSNPTGGAALGDTTGVGTLTNDDALLSCPASVTAGNTFAVEVFGGGSATDWLGLYPDGAGNTAYTAWSYVTLPRPRTVDLVAPASPGPFDIRLWAANGITTLLGACDVVVVPRPTLVVADLSLPEGNAGASDATFTLTMQPAPAADVTVSYATANGTAMAGSDYTARTGSVVFHIGETTQSVTVPVTGDATVEADETFSLGITGVSDSGVAVGDGTGVATVTNDDALLTCPASALPGATFDVQVSGGSSATDWVALYPDGAGNGAYVAWAYVPLPRPQTVTLTAPATPGLHEVRLWANNTTATLLGSCALPVATAPTLTVGDVAVAEGDSGTTTATFTLRLLPAAAGTVTVEYATADGTAAAEGDYLPATGLVTFAAGETAKTVTVTVNGEAVAEGAETFFLDLSNATGGAVIGDGRGVATIAAGDGSLACPAAVAPGDPFDVHVQGGTTATDWVALYADGAPSGAFSAWSYVPLPRPQTVSLTAPLTPGSYDVRLWAANTTSQLLGACDVAVVTGPTLLIGDVSVLEGHAGTTSAVFNVTLTPPAAGPVTVNYATDDGTATAAAPTTATLSNTTPVSTGDDGPGTPYPSTLSVGALPGVVSQVAVTLHGFGHEFPADVDVLLVGPQGQAVVLLSDGGGSTDVSGLDLTFSDTGASLPLTLATGTYRPTNVEDYEGDDLFPATAPAGPWASSLSVFDGLDPAGTWQLYVRDDFGDFTGELAGGWSLAITTRGDYGSMAGTLTFTAGQASKTITVPVYGDPVAEGVETFVVELSAAAGAALGDAQATGTILDDECVDSDADGLCDGVETHTGVYVGPHDTGSDPGNPDTDGDSLQDGWEVNGRNGIDLAARGASPLRKDVFVEMDYMVRGSAANGLGPSPAVTAGIVASFAAAPVANPDGSTGISLHLELGNEVPYDDDLDPVFTEFAALKAAHFAPERAPIYRYMIWADVHSDSTSSGQSFGTPSTDFIVTLGSWNDEDGGTDAEKIGTFLHQLGHIMGLTHGGDDYVDFKPNYFSVMNSLWQTTGVLRGGGAYFDYQRFPLPALDEASLAEPAGLGGGAAVASYKTARFCVDDLSFYLADADAPIDWNCDGDAVDADVEVDVNDDFWVSTLGSQDNWASVVFDGGGIIGSARAPKRLLEQVREAYSGQPLEELTWETELQIRRRLDRNPTP